MTAGGVTSQPPMPGLGQDYWECFGCGRVFVGDKAAMMVCMDSHGGPKGLWALARERHGHAEVDE